MGPMRFRSFITRGYLPYRTYPGGLTREQIYPGDFRFKSTQILFLENVFKDYLAMFILLKSSEKPFYISHRLFRTVIVWGHLPGRAYPGEPTR